MLTNQEQSASPGSTRFDTGMVPNVARLEFWNRVNTESFSEISVDPRNDTLHGVLERREQGALRIARVHSSAVVVRGGRFHRANGLLLHLQEAGSSLNGQLNRSSLLRVGDITFCDAGRPYTVQCDAPVQMIVVKIPYELLATRFASMDEFVTLHVDGTRGSGAILASFVRSVWVHCAELGNSEIDRGAVMISALLDLMALVQDSRAESSLMAGSATLHRDMRAYVENGLADPNLSVSSLADAFGVTSRHVHRIFADFGVTPSNYILESRLNLAAARLRDTKGIASITRVAFDSGFSDSTTFSRAFRKRYGVSPRDYRRERRVS
jgi:AraC-like DNA-binding protein